MKVDTVWRAIWQRTKKLNTGTQLIVSPIHWPSKIYFESQHWIPLSITTAIVHFSVILTNLTIFGTIALYYEEVRDLFLYECTYTIKPFTFSLVARWCNGKAFGLAITRSRVQFLLEATLRNNLRQVVYTYVPLSPSSITWYRPKGGNALRLGR